MTSSLSHAWVRDSEVVKRDMAQEWYVVGGENPRNLHSERAVHEAEYRKGTA
jgi:hypothetical protein